jgi:hypothetical protein
VPSAPIGQIPFDPVAKIHSHHPPGPHILRRIQLRVEPWPAKRITADAVARAGSLTA